VHDILVNNASGLLGRFLDIILNEIFPYLILGALFGASAGGRSLTLTSHIAGASKTTAKVAAAMVAEELHRHVNGLPAINPY